MASDRNSRRWPAARPLLLLLVLLWEGGSGMASLLCVVCGRPKGKCRLELE